MKHAIALATAALLIAASAQPASAEKELNVVAEVLAAESEVVVDEAVAVPLTDTTAAPTEAAKPEQTTPAPKPKDPALGTLKFHLMDGTIITGKLTAKSLPIKTEFGDLVVPITAIITFSPGLASHPDLDQRISKLIEQLGDPNTKQRDKAQASLVGYGPGIIPELQRFTDDQDAERKARIATMIEELFSMKEDFELDDQSPTVSLNRLDTIQTEHFTVAGSIEQDDFTIQSKFGKLKVKLADVKAAQRITADKPELRKAVKIAGSDMAGRNYKNTGIRLNRGDKVIINADGKITLTPWGNNVVSSPDGVAQNGMYNGTIPMGALAGRIGDSGEEFLVGRKKTFTADKSGVLYLGFAMQQNWQNYQFPGDYEAKIRVVPVQ